MKKSVYEAPVLRQHGAVEAITKMNLGGSTTDSVFSASTPLSDITTS
ncbi:MAG: lasso RiPP family leader peptide-containing protein [Pseudomonadota bacterium]